LTSFVQDIIDDKSYVVELVTSVNPYEEKFYAYVLMQVGLLEKFKKTLDEKDVDLEEWGVILASGEGHTPPDSVHEYITKKLFTASNPDLDVLVN